MIRPYRFSNEIEVFRVDLKQPRPGKLWIPVQGFDPGNLYFSSFDPPLSSTEKRSLTEAVLSFRIDQGLPSSTLESVQRFRALGRVLRLQDYLLNNVASMPGSFEIIQARTGSRFAVFAQGPFEVPANPVKAWADLPEPIRQALTESMPMSWFTESGVARVTQILQKSGASRDTEIAAFLPDWKILSSPMQRDILEALPEGQRQQWQGVVAKGGH